MLPPDELSALAEDIKKFGQIEPIVTHEGAILDGRNRFAACEMAGVPPKTRAWSGEHKTPTRYAITVNVQRRHLTQSQKTVVALEALPLLEEEAQERKREKAAESMRGNSNAKTVVPEIRDNRSSGPPKTREKHSASEDAAALVGVSRAYVEEAKALVKAKPELKEKIASGEVTLSQAKREVKEEQREQRRQENREKVVATAGTGKLEGRFAVIVLDPPWDWGDEGDQDQLGRARPDYGTLSIDQLHALEVDGRQVKDLADQDAHIYLWITNRSLPKGFALLESWGFRYVTALTWGKPSFGMGNYFRGQTEHVLFGVRGSQSLKRKDVGTLLLAPRGPGGHSSKPDEFYSLVESCSPGPWVSLFDRRTRPGWVMWGEGGVIRG